MFAFGAIHYSVCTVKQNRSQTISYTPGLFTKKKNKTMLATRRRRIVVECTALERRQGVTALMSSNLIVSAINKKIRQKQDEKELIRDPKISSCFGKRKKRAVSVVCE